MIEFLLSLLLFVFGLGSTDHPVLEPETIISRIEEFITNVQEPEGDPENLYPPMPAQAQNPDSSEQGVSEKVRAYNTASGKVVGEVAAVAVEKAPPLVDCVEVPELCNPEPEPQADPTPPIPTPIPEPTPTPIELPDPLPCIVPPPCIYSKPACLLPVPKDGWCPFPTPTPLPIVIPPKKPPFDCDPPPPYILGGKTTPQSLVVCLE